MKTSIRLTFLMLFILFGESGLYSQTRSLPEIFKDNFEKATLEVKLEVVKDAVDLELDGMGPLFYTGLRYCVDNYKTEGANASFKELMQICIGRVKELKYKAATSDLINLFQLEPDTIFKIDILDALTGIAPGDALVIKAMNRFLSIQNESYRTAKKYERDVVMECIKDLGIMGDPSSFSPILIAVILKYSDEVTSVAEEAISRLSVDRKTAYLNFLLEELFPDKLAAYKRALSDGKLSIEDKCLISEFALNVSIHTAVISQDNRVFVTDLRNASLAFLANNHWSHAADILIENFNIAVSDYDKNITGKSVVLNAIDALGNMRSHEAAKRLVLYLEYVNSYTERGKAYDEEIVNHVIAALKQLGDIVARQSLLYTRYLNYSDMIKKNAFDAYQALK